MQDRELIAACHTSLRDLMIMLHDNRQTMEQQQWSIEDLKALLANRDARIAGLVGQLEDARSAVRAARCDNPLRRCDTETVRPMPVGEILEASLTQEERLRLQSDLTVLGFYDGRQDGVFGSQTQASIERFQAFNSQESNGLLSEEIIYEAARQAALYMRALRLAPAPVQGLPVRQPNDTERLLALGRQLLSAPGRTAEHEATAAYWLTAAARRDSLEALSLLAEMYAAGTGVPKRQDLATILLRTAAAKGFEPALAAMTKAGTLQALDLEAELSAADSSTSTEGAGNAGDDKQGPIK